jgi:5-methylcytosine-specific restriction enzyme A
VRASYLAKNPLCVCCAKEKRVEPATELDHITPHRGDQQLFWDKSNWQGLCKTHHSRKTATEDSRFAPRGGV